VDNEFLTGIIIGGDNMAVCYKKLWKMLIDKDMIKKDLRLKTGFSTTTMSKMSAWM
jgi:putative transcriptional regulator